MIRGYEGWGKLFGNDFERKSLPGALRGWIGGEVTDVSWGRACRVEGCGMGRGLGDYEGGEV